jgi:hypothetical protein
MNANGTQIKIATVANQPAMSSDLTNKKIWFFKSNNPHELLPAFISRVVTSNLFITLSFIKTWAHLLKL